MKIKIWSAILAAAAALSIAPAHAAQYKFQVFMDGLQETPPVATPGSGTAIVLFDSVTGLMNVDGTFSDLIGNTTAAHVHGYAPTGTPAGIVFHLLVDLGTSGNVSGSGTIPSANIQDVLNGLTYINIHTTFRPGGEIRGQMIDPILVPEPAAGLMLCCGVAAIVLQRRRTRSAR